MVSPHIHVPYDRLEEYFGFIRDNRFNLEIYFTAAALSAIRSTDIIHLKQRLDYAPELSIHAPFMDLSPGAVDPKVRAVTVSRFLQVFDIAEILEPVAVVFHSGYDKWKYALNAELWLEKSLMTWRVFIRKALAIGTKLVIENVFEDEPTNLKMLMERIASDSVGICFDTGHCNLFSTVPIDEWMRQLRPYILEVHLHDNSRRADDHMAIGDGTFNFDRFFSLLKGKEVLYTIEGHNPSAVLRSIEKMKEYL